MRRLAVAVLVALGVAACVAVVELPIGTTGAPTAIISPLPAPTVVGPETILPSAVPWSADTGVVGEVVVAGGPPPGNAAQGEPAGLTISAASKMVLRRRVTSGATVRVLLPPGTYGIAGSFGNAECIGASVKVTAGAFAAFQVVCSIR